MDHRTRIDGYTVAYEGEDMAFPVFVVLGAGVALLVWAFTKHNPYLLLPGAAAIGYGYYNVPLLETGRPRLGAGQYGLFIEGLGVIAWRAVGTIELVPVSSRGAVDQHLSIRLAKPLEAALIADWRKRPAHRILMRLPWSLRNSEIRIPLEVFDQPPGDIHRNLTRLWRYFGA